jgi:hypothetical protein
MNLEEQRSKMISQIISEAWSDEAFKERLLKDAMGVVKEVGLELPQGVEIRAVADPDERLHFGDGLSVGLHWQVPSHSANREFVQWLKHLGEEQRQQWQMIDNSEIRFHIHDSSE